MGVIIYYLFIKPLSLLPLPILYIFSDGLFILLYFVIGFRKKVVFTNLNNSFPDKNKTEIKQIARQFYQHFCDLMLESIRMTSISKEELLRRCPVVNPEIFEPYARQGKSIIVVAGHYNNWELAAIPLRLQIAHSVIGIYHPLSNAFLDKKLLKSRSRFGMEMVDKKYVKPFFEENQGRPIAYLFGSDQSPSNARKAYWTSFLNQDTAVFYGAEKYAKEYNYPVMFAMITKLRRGYYEMSFQLLEENPAETNYGHISELHTRALEKQILQAPQYWLWTHRRWKRKREDALLEN